MRACQEIINHFLNNFKNIRSAQSEEEMRTEIAKKCQKTPPLGRRGKQAGQRAFSFFRKNEKCEKSYLKIRKNTV
jgi:hypothetical protein